VDAHPQDSYAGKDAFIETVKGWAGFKPQDQDPGYGNSCMLAHHETP
jgi:hypothetical protein